MASYKTPGVYIEEISLFPPSVAQVETAIPAFIGYTQKAIEFANDDLLNVPTKIGSMIEFVQHFGGAPSVNITDVNLDSLNQVTSVKLTDNYYLYDAMRMFFANGGGYCYIVSIGYYGAPIVNGTGLDAGFLKGLAALRKVDEPTMLLAPDASLMLQTDMDTLHIQMLAQCAELQDRFCIFDVRKADTLQTYQTTIDNFRNGIGMGNLKYGAAYSPWIVANLPREIKYKDYKNNIKQNGSPVLLPDLITDVNAKVLAMRLNRLTVDQVTVAAGITSLRGASTSVQERYDTLISGIKGAALVGPAKAALKDLGDFFIAASTFINSAVNTPTLTDVNGPILTIPVTDSLVTFLQGKIGTAITAGRATISRFIADANDPLGATTPILPIPPVGYPVAVGAQAYFLGGAASLIKIQSSYSDYDTIWSSIVSMLDMIVSTTDSFAATFETAASESIPVMKTISRAIAANYLTLPPSSTMAGIYARVDNDRGVWKAPANVSINSAVGVTELIDNKEQASLNVDVIAGKSINIIRPFTGKGILVWGARTLAGNDNEWRYIPVRRFYIMAEESIRKATEQFVFEPNDANTWVRLRAMIENFLTLQWRAGALAGAKPDQAFFVRVGLGETMTSQDILEGRMNIEIGMAVVRPAEFIILKFSHKMQEA